MMGTSHAASGAAAWIALTATALPAVGVHELTPAAVLLGAPIAAGAALLPDADHHSATVARAVPVAGRLAAEVLGAVSGGHRKGMHSLLAVAAVMIGMRYLGQIVWQPGGDADPFLLGVALAVAACTAPALKALRIARRWGPAWLGGTALGAIAGLLAPEQLTWLPWCLGVGYVAHIIGDLLTTGGVPFLWPIRIPSPRWARRTPLLRHIWLRGGGIAVPVLGDTGSGREKLLALGLSAYALWGVCAEAATAIRPGS
ncbi:metal-dependent hydrolase [Microbacterium oryzae]|uniref:metal-dependent hydrolase n=1 Tax=Microbacterium oryzae TaxID=743009 RepID=UPI0025B019A5|nr:metal-dependent hydrolase [Microbacterium oryzae]MDN3311055.1 metal-dependent hydrolase [Microbacterium oryzae]